MLLNDMTSGFIIGLLVILATHSVISKYWLAGLIAGAICSVANVVHEGYLLNFTMSPSDVMIWVPMLLVMGVAIFTPLSYFLGLPFFLYRRRKKNMTAAKVEDEM